jgi:hypothetical protein
MFVSSIDFRTWMRTAQRKDEEHASAKVGGYARGAWGCWHGVVPETEDGDPDVTGRSCVVSIHIPDSSIVIADVRF